MREEAAETSLTFCEFARCTGPDVTEVWFRFGPMTGSCTGETYRDKVRLTFANGASLNDPAGLFNSSLGGGTRGAIDFHQNDHIEEHEFKDLIREAVARNES